VDFLNRFVFLHLLRNVLFSFVVDLLVDATVNSILFFAFAFGLLLACGRSLLSEDILTCLEFFLNLSQGGNFALHPRVTNDLGHGKAIHRVVSKHVGHQVNEILRVEIFALDLLVSLPEDIRLLHEEELVVRVLGVSLIEWRMAREHDEHDDSDSKQVNLVSSVLTLFFDFWRHVARRTELREEQAFSVTALNRGSEAKVNNTQVELIVDENIFWLQVAMAGTARMARVQSVKHVAEVVAANLARGRAESEEVKELALLHQLQSDVVDLLGLSIGEGLHCVGLMSERLHNVGVLNVLVDLILVCDLLEHSLTAF